jgi:hypothetical protein
MIRNLDLLERVSKIELLFYSEDRKLKCGKCSALDLDPHLSGSHPVVTLAHPDK